MYKKISCLFIILVVICESTVLGANFKDINGHWAEKVVLDMVDKGILNGFLDGTFRPDESVTREQFAKILVKSLNINYENSSLKFEDVSDDRWSKDYIIRANKYLTGYYIKGKYYFKPTEASVREDIAVAVVMASGLQDEIPEYSLLEQFSDKDEISENSRKYIAIAVKNGIMQGKGGYFDPKGNLTRAEVSQLIFNVREKVVMGEFTKEFVYGDLNGDEKITKWDYNKVNRYVNGNTILDKGKEKSADVDLDGKITDNDVWLIYVAIHENIKLPHKCKSYSGKYEELNDEKHRRIETCACGEIVYKRKESHDYENGKCICGYKEPTHKCSAYETNYEKMDNTNHKVIVRCECKKVLSETKEVHEFEDDKCKCGFSIKKYIMSLSDEQFLTVINDLMKKKEYNQYAIRVVNSCIPDYKKLLDNYEIYNLFCKIKCIKVNPYDPNNPNLSKVRRAVNASENITINCFEGELEDDSNLNGLKWLITHEIMHSLGEFPNWYTNNNYYNEISGSKVSVSIRNHLLEEGLADSIGFFVKHSNHNSSFAIIKQKEFAMYSIKNNNQVNLNANINHTYILSGNIISLFKYIGCYDELIHANINSDFDTLKKAMGEKVINGEKYFDELFELVNTIYLYTEYPNTFLSQETVISNNQTDENLLNIIKNNNLNDLLIQYAKLSAEIINNRIDKTYSIDEIIKNNLILYSEDGINFKTDLKY